MFANQYLLKGKVINQINQVCAADITYVPMEKGFDYLVTIINWHSRKMLSWFLSNFKYSRMSFKTRVVRRYSIPIRALSLPAKH
ncbi:MAG TPA: hypothetical protein PLN59_08665 [Nitrosomonas sp.]|nr:hypothetical protein [Nitrosomonas sp.]